MYRINYGNGQVSNTIKTYKAAVTELRDEQTRGDQYVLAYRIQILDCGEWHYMGAKGRLATDDRAGL